MRHKSGEWLWILDKGMVIERDEEGKALRACGTHLDITERKKARKKLEETHKIMNKSPIVVFLWGNSEGWPVEHVSENVEDLFGYTAEEFMSGEVAYASTVHPDDLERVGAEVAAYSGEPGRKEFTQEYRIVARDGKVEWTDDRTFIRRNEKGEITHYQGIVLDITARKRAEEETRRLATITEQAVEGIAVADFEGTILFANRAWAEMHGYETGDELIGENLSIFHTEEQLKNEVIPFNEEVMRRGHNLGEMGHVRKDGTIFPSTMSVALLKDEKGTPYALAGFMQDITERKQAEGDLKKAQTELIQAEKLASLGQLAAGIAHEINTPSQFVGDNIKFLGDAYQDLRKLISSFTEFLPSARQGEVPEGLVGDVERAVEEADLGFLFDEIPKAIEQSQEGVQRIGHIVRSMKQFSHPGAKDKTFADVNECIETTVTVCRNEWKYAAEMVMDLDRSIPSVPLYQNEFNQVVLNIVLNAALAIKEKIGESPKEKGTITISTGHDGKFVEVRVKDTGTGIPEEIRGKIFDPFFTSREVGKGTGQGLAISHSVIVEKHGGTVGFETEVGEGATFVIRLPLG